MNDQPNNSGTFAVDAVGTGPVSRDDVADAPYVAPDRCFEAKLRAINRDDYDPKALNLAGPKPGHADGFYVPTFSGRRLHPFSPAPQDILLKDIIHGLSNLSHYFARSLEYYSIAQHCVLVSLHCEPGAKLHSLLHHAEEAYLGVMPLPMQSCGYFRRYRSARSHLREAIFAKFKAPLPWPNSVAQADMLIMATEERDLIPHQITEKRHQKKWGKRGLPQTITPWSPAEAANRLALRFHQVLKGETNQAHALEIFQDNAAADEERIVYEG